MTTNKKGIVYKFKYHAQKQIMHVVYNPQLDSLQKLLDDVGEDWQLLKIVPVHEYEAVAVFEK